jgi:hypothetical protein
MNRIPTVIATLLLAASTLPPCIGQDSLMQVKQLVQLKNYFVTQGLPVQHYAFDDALVNAKLWAVLNHNHKAQQKQTAAGILTGLGVVLMTITVVLAPDDGLDGLGYSLSTGPILFMSGISCGVASIPLWIAGGKQLKARNAAIAEANALLMR